MSGDAGLVDRVIDRTVARAEPFLNTFIYGSALFEEDLFRWLTRHARRTLGAEKEGSSARVTVTQTPDSTEQSLLDAKQRVRQDTKDLRDGVAN